MRSWGVNIGMMGPKFWKIKIQYLKCKKQKDAKKNASFFFGITQIRTKPVRINFGKRTFCGHFIQAF